MWDIKTLNQINQADDLKIAPFHPDMQTTGTPTWIWEVVVENRLFVRAYFGTNSRWFQAALAQKEGKIYAVNAVYDVRFEHIVDDVLNDKIDIAYRQKYAGSPYVEHMISTACRNATMEIIFVKKEA
ncbi:DUF2255 family protein [Gallibacterium anatis]|uniref:DUF2255 family protein n=1 Tax=Gallibacterium anatis TaxID=750 RepID=UPI0005315408|nr:DUF2255 family protein [Gallibacterium anatis]KGQ67238.1 hypothetical protein IO49_01395 [Gallibacterium anatis]